MKHEETSLAIMERAAVLLAEANTIQEAKDLKALALTAEDWARRKGLGKATEQHCHAYAVRAEIKMGEMLSATRASRAKGAADGRPGPGRGNAVPMRDRVLDTPTLADLGVTKKEASRAQRLAELPPAKQEAVIAGTLTPSAALRTDKPHPSNSNNKSRAPRTGRLSDPLRAALNEGREWMLRWKHLNALASVFVELNEVLSRHGGAE